LTVSRRTFLKTAFAAAICLCGGEAFPSILPAAEGARESSLSLYNTHTRERLDVSFRDDRGNPDPEALEAVNRILRCHYTQEVAPIDFRVIEYLNAVDKALGGKNPIHIISGYRSRAYNDMLFRQGRGVSPRSLHLAGRAIDFRIPGVDLKTVARTALDLKAGGVGFYPSSDFVHIDSGRVRSW
jgi:uncharacterized protein YcbK (DUF882 family)